MMQALPALMLLSVFMAVALILLGANFLQTDRHQRRLDARLARVCGVLIVQDVDPDDNVADSLARFRRPLARLLALTGVDLVRAPDYPAPWWAMLILAALLARGAAFLIGLLFGGFGWLAWPVLVILFARFIFGAVHARRSAALLAQFPDTLATIVRCVRVGIPVQEALRLISRDMPAPTSAEFGRIADQVAIGTPLDHALRQLAERARLPEYGFFATALSLQARSGGGLAQTLETLAEVIRKRVAMKARGYALASEARTSALILGVIPIISGVAIEVLQPDYLRVLFITRKGHIVFGAAVSMLIVGALTMRAIIRRSLS